MTAAPLAERAAGAVEKAVEQAAERRPLEPQQRQQLADQLAQFQRQAGGVNLLNLLTWYVPTLAGSLQARGHILAAAPAQIGSGPVLAAVLIGLALLSFLLVGLFLSPLAQVVRLEQLRLAELARGLLPATTRFGGYILLVVVAFALAAIPLALLSTLLAALAAPLAALAVLLATALFLWALLHLSMADKAVFVSGSGPVQAAGLSVALVRRYFWPALWLFVLVNVILQGTPLAWRLITGHPLGALVAMVGNAYIATGVVAGTVVFYRDRALALQGVSATERSG